MNRFVIEDQRHAEPAGAGLRRSHRAKVKLRIWFRNNQQAIVEGLRDLRAGAVATGLDAHQGVGGLRGARLEEGLRAR